MAAATQDRLLQALIGIGQEFASTTELETLLDRILHAARDVFGFDNAIIRLLDVDDQELRTAAYYGYPPDVAEAGIQIGRGVMGRSAQTAAPVLVNEVDKDPDYVPGITDAKSELAVPMMVRDRLIGVFNVESRQPDAFDQDDILPLLTLAGQAAIAIENARLYSNLRCASDRYQRLHHLNDRILNHANLGIYTIDKEIIVTAWNRWMSEVSGLESHQVIGRPLFELFPHLQDEGFAETLLKTFQTGRSERMQLLHRTQSGEVKFQKRSVAPLKEGEEIVGAVVMIEDITEFRRLIEQTIQMEKLAEMGKLSATLSHEINNPLAVISYAAQLLLRDEPLREFQKELIERIHEEAERLKTLSGSMLSFARDRAESFRPVNLNDLLAEVLRLLSFEILRHNISLVEEYQHTFEINADPNRLKQVFINLIMNAIQAMSPSGRLTICTAPSGPDRVEVTICDTGKGIPPDNINLIFDPFFTTKPDGEGTGLGLYVCRHIVIEHQGELTVSSKHGEGTSFRLILPTI